MPRNPGAKKNQHNHKHENGLVGPGKRITKQKSNGQLNAAPRVIHPATPPLTPVNSHSLLNVQVDHEANGSQPELKSDDPSDTRPAGLPSRDSESSNDGQEPASNGHLHQKPSEEGTLRRQEHTSPKPKTSHDVSAIQLASTILKSCPAYDTIAILILLLQLPPLILTGIQLLFASLTFMPPAGLSFGSMFSLFDVFQGSAGAPSLGTMIFVDAICFGLWFCVWTWAQNFALDLAQVQIAITLGGGGPGKSGGVNGICLGIVLLLHMVRSKDLRGHFFNWILPPRVLSNQYIARIAQFMPRESEFGDTPSSPSWLHSLFAVHIVTQALMAFIRRRVANSQAASTTKGSKRVDPEASAGSQPSQDASAFDIAMANATGGDYQPPPTPGFKDGKDKSVSAKKRRRQANQVRSRQPFWAALASTKVTVMREYEHSRGSTKSAGRQLDEGVDTNTGDEIIWITRVDPSTIEFEASNIPQAEEDQEAGLSICSKPFYVRINGARWHSFNLSYSNGQKDSTAGQWTGEISALAPNCAYTCSFVHFDDDEEFTSILVKTPALPDRDHSSSLVPPPIRQPTGPSSPTTTIKNSIQNAEAKLNEARNRLLKSRRAHKAGLSKIEKEVESYNIRLKSSIDDTKLRQKLLQAQNNIRQSEDATAAIAAALDALEVIPEDEAADHTSRKEAFQKQSDLLTAANESLTAARSEADNEVATITSELNTIVARRERLTARQTRLTEQNDRITQANTQGLNERERRAAESQAKEIEQMRMEDSYHAQFNIINSEISSLQMRTNQAWQEIQAFEKQISVQREAMLKNEGQLTPEGNLPGTNPLHVNSRAFGYGFPNLSMPPPNTMSPESVHASPFLAYAKALPSDNQRRARSASNRSGGAVSNFSADFEDADPIPPMPAVNDFDLNEFGGRKGSGSSRGHNNGSPSAMGMLGLGSPIQGRGSPGRGIW